MLVLTTIFIDVSNNLPKTSYMKMVDVWLLFSLLLPFTVVLTHTYMDTLRPEQEEKTIKQGNNKKSANKLNFWKKFSLFYNPILVVTFALLYWLIVLRQANLM